MTPADFRKILDEGKPLPLIRFIRDNAESFLDLWGFASIVSLDCGLEDWDRLHETLEKLEQSK